MYCQKCRSPLKLDSSLEDLNPAAFKLLAGKCFEYEAGFDTHEYVDASTSPDAMKSSRNRKHLPSYQQERLADYDAAAQNARPASIKQSFTHAPRSRGKDPNMSFVMLTESQVLDSPTPKPKKQSSKDESLPPSQQTFLKDRTEATESIFEVLSSRSDIDHPICTDCTEILVEGLQKRLVHANKERDAYVDFLRQANADIPSEDEVRQAEQEHQRAKKEEQSALEELRNLEAEKAELEKDILGLDSVLRDLEIREEKFWEQRNEHFMDLTKYQNERDRVNNQFEFDTKQLQRLQRANVYNDTFAIGYDGYFGTINGLRLGRLPDRAVEWSEINAAWGHTCLLLATVAEKLHFQFFGFELRPMGSTSQIVEYISRKPSGNRSNDTMSQDKKKIHELFTSGDYSLGMALFSRKFDTAMIAFLECLKQLISHAESTQVPGPNGQPVVCPPIPYKIDKDMIGEASIKLGGFNQEMQWTKACKSMLICCKYLLAHASNISELGQRTDD
jgi:beclin 1